MQHTLIDVQAGPTPGRYNGIPRSMTYPPTPSGPDLFANASAYLVKIAVTTTPGSPMNAGRLMRCASAPVVVSQVLGVSAS